MSEWISVYGERFPPAVNSWGDNPPSVSDDVLCYWPDEAYGIGYYDWSEGKWYLMNPTGDTFDANCEPTHWMPLPSPPSAEKEER